MHMAIRYCEYLRHTAAAQIAYKITRSRSTQVALGKVEGFRETLKARWKNLKWMLASYINAVSSLAAYATWTNQLVPSRLTLWISPVTLTTRQPAPSRVSWLNYTFVWMKITNIQSRKTFSSLNRVLGFSKIFIFFPERLHKSKYSYIIHSFIHSVWYFIQIYSSFLPQQ